MDRCPFPLMYTLSAGHFVWIRVGMSQPILSRIVKLSNFVLVFPIGYQFSCTIRQNDCEAHLHDFKNWHIAKVLESVVYMVIHRINQSVAFLLHLNISQLFWRQFNALILQFLMINLKSIRKAMRVFSWSLL